MNLKAVPFALALFAAATPLCAQQQSGGGAPTTVGVGPSNNDTGVNAEALFTNAPVSNNWYTSFGLVVNTGNAATASRIACVPMVILTTITVKALGVRVTTAGTSNLQLALYGNSAGYPGSLLASTASISNGAGIGSATITATTLTPGVYWGCTNANDSTMILQGPAASSGILGWATGGTAGGTVSNSANALFLDWYYSGTFGTWPATLGSSGATAGSVQQGPALLMESQ